MHFSILAFTVYQCTSGMILGGFFETPHDGIVYGICAYKMCFFFDDVFNYRRKEKVKWNMILRRGFQTGGRDPPRGWVMMFRGHRENIRIYTNFTRKCKMVYSQRPLTVVKNLRHSAKRLS